MENQFNIGVLVKNRVNGPLWSGIKLALASTGALLVLGVVIQVFFGSTAGSTGRFMVGAFVGLIISAYATYVLHMKYSRAHTAFFSLIVAGVVTTALTMALPSDIGARTAAENAVVEFARIVGCFFGWHVARMQTLRLYLLSDQWVNALMLLGIILNALIVAVIFLGGVVST